MSRFTKATGSGFPGTGLAPARQIWALGMLLLFVLFVMLTFRGKVPQVVERVFAPPPATEETLQKHKETIGAIANGAYYDAADGAPFMETPGYGRLLQRLTDHVRPGDLVENPPLFDYDLAMRAPEQQRGETVKVRGLVNERWAQKLDHPVFQLTDVWRVVLTDVNGDDGLYVDVVEKPPELDPRHSIVEFTGTLYRLVGFESKKGENRTVPYLLARSLVVVPERRDITSPFADPKVVLLLLGMAAMIVWGVFRVFSSQRRPQVRWRAPHLR